MPSLLDLLGETWPARMAKSAWSAAKLPGDVYAGRTDPLSDEGIGRAADLGGLVMGGTYVAAPAGAVGAGAVKPIRAYHGSPHDFDRFDLSKIGTGEGAQAYGHGLYFAENPTVAQQYRDTLAPSRGKLPDDIISLPPEMRQAIMAHAGTDVDAVTAAKRAQYMSAALRKDDLAKVTDMIERARVAKQGRMYEVNINADPAHMLDWDKALSQQPQKVAETLKSMGLYPRQTSTGAHYDPAGSVAYDALKVPRTSSGNDVAATNMLNEAGIPGIKYLDQGSRTGGGDAGRMAQGMIDKFGSREAALTTAQERLKSAGMGDLRYWDNIVNELSKPQSSNYVLFRDDIIDIVKKYGLAGAAAMYGISQD